MDRVAALLLVLQDHRQLAEVDVALLQVVLARDRAQVQDLEVLGERHDHAVDVGQLVAFGVDRPVVGIALHHPGRVVDRLDGPPGAEHRQLGVERPVLLEVQVCDPVVEACGLGRGVGRLDPAGVFGQELLQVVRGRIGAVAALLRLAHRLPAADQRVAGHQLLEQVERHVELEVDRVVVDFHDPSGLARRRHVRDRRRHDVLVAVDVLEPEHEVGGGQRRAVRPFDALAQMKRVGLAVRAHLPALGERGARHIAGVVDQDRAVGGLDAVAVLVVAGPGEAAPPGAAVAADPVDRPDHHQVLGQALRDRRQLALGDPRRELGRLAEGLRPLRRVLDDRDALELADQPGFRERALSPRAIRGQRGEQRCAGQQRDREPCRGAHPECLPFSFSPAGGPLRARGDAVLRIRKRGTDSFVN